MSYITDICAYACFIFIKKSFIVNFVKLFLVQCYFLDQPCRKCYSLMLITFRYLYLVEQQLFLSFTFNQMCMHEFFVKG